MVGENTELPVSPSEAERRPLCTLVLPTIAEALRASSRTRPMPRSSESTSTLARPVRTSIAPGIANEDDAASGCGVWSGAAAALGAGASAGDANRAEALASPNDAVMDAAAGIRADMLSAGVVSMAERLQAAIAKIVGSRTCWGFMRVPHGPDVDDLIVTVISETFLSRRLAHGTPKRARPYSHISVVTVLLHVVPRGSLTLASVRKTGYSTVGKFPTTCSRIEATVKSTPDARALVVHRLSGAPGRVARALSFSVLVAGFALPLRAQAAPTRRFETGIVIGGDWLQANALPLDRDAAESLDISLSLRRQIWAFDGGWLRIARTLSTVQGGYLSAGRILHLGPVLFIPAIGALAGQALESRDSTGFDFVDGAGVVGHTPRYSNSAAFTFGGSVGLTVEVPIYRALGFRAVGSEWLFSGAPLDGDRSRGVVGAGLSLRVR